MKTKILVFLFISLLSALPITGQSQSEQIYTIKPLKWEKSKILSHIQYAATPDYNAYIIRSRGQSVYLSYDGKVFKSASIEEAKKKAESDYHRKVERFLIKKDK